MQHLLADEGVAQWAFKRLFDRIGLGDHNLCAAVAEADVVAFLYRQLAFVVLAHYTLLSLVFCGLVGFDLCENVGRVVAIVASRLFGQNAVYVV